MKWAIGIQYQGSAYCGWQTQLQDKVPTIQAELERALAQVLDHPVSIVCAGRTDKGVHALSQIAHFETDSIRPERAFVLGANSNLPQDISIKWAQPVTDEFHARFSATHRHYQYVIYNQRTPHAVFAQQSTWIYRPLAIEPMQQAAQFLLGEHDFSGFRGPHCQAKSPVRSLEHLSIKRQGPWVSIDIVANAFLHHMVRNIVGVLLPIGYGAKDTNYTKTVLESRDRRQGGITAPANGLYFVNVAYPEHFGIKQSEQTKAPAEILAQTFGGIATA